MRVGDKKRRSLLAAICRECPSLIPLSGPGGHLVFSSCLSERSEVLTGFSIGSVSNALQLDMLVFPLFDRFSKPSLIHGLCAAPFPGGDRYLEFDRFDAASLAKRFLEAARSMFDQIEQLSQTEFFVEYLENFDRRLLEYGPVAAVLGTSYVRLGRISDAEAQLSVAIDDLSPNERFQGAVSDYIDLRRALGRGPEEAAQLVDEWVRQRRVALNL